MRSMKNPPLRSCSSLFIACVLLLLPVLARGAEGADFRLYVSNERSGDITVIDGKSLKTVSTIAVGKRPRGIHASPDGRSIYVALSGSPIAGPPDAAGRSAPGGAAGKGNGKGKGKDDDDDAANADKSADAIGVIDVRTGEIVRRLKVGSDPEEFDLSRDGRQIYVSNEDDKAASVIDIASGKLAHAVAVSQEPEGVRSAPDGRSFYVTCEAEGDIYVIDTKSFSVKGHFKVPLRPRTVEFMPGAPLAFIPSEITGVVNVVDTGSLSILKSVQLPEGSKPMHVRVSPDHRRLYVSNGRAATVSVLDTRSYELIDTIKVGARPWGMVLSPDGRMLFTANGPSNDVSVVDLSQDKEIARIPAGQGPWGITVVPGGH